MDELKKRKLLNVLGWIPAIVVTVALVLAIIFIVPQMGIQECDSFALIDITYLSGRQEETVTTKTDIACNDQILYFKLNQTREGNYSFYQDDCDNFCEGILIFKKNITCSLNDEYYFLVRIEKGRFIVIAFALEGIAKISFV